MSMDSLVGIERVICGMERRLLLGGNEMGSLRTEHAGVTAILLVLYALRIRYGSSLLPIILWLDNAEVLDRATKKNVGVIMKKHLVLGYDLWQAMTMGSLQKRIKTPLIWEKVGFAYRGKYI